MVECPGWDVLGAGLSSVMGKHSHHVWPFLKQLVRMGTRYPVHSSQRSLPLSSQYVVSLAPGVADLARERSSSGLSREVDSSPQVPPTAVSYSGSSSKGRLSAGLDSLLMFLKSARSRLHVGLWCTTEMDVGVSSHL
ncbi:hypothetical protein E2C01_032421 [Portunus trituberculatus]|uniref:Uncharacterized protein n=1 Tax=Portunus trituberculatus TaxID=210409 RepID=A0A5B7F2R5_PORTR|nr:hypothetical protein [Portunus trituberculatus]